MLFLLTIEKEHLDVDLSLSEPFEIIIKHKYEEINQFYFRWLC